MNKYFWLLLIFFLPIIAAGIWFFTVSQDNVTAAAVSAVKLELPDGTITEYVSDDDKEFFVELLDNIKSIEKQDYDENVHSLHKLSFERVQGDVQYYLCLSADSKNCLAFDSSGDWYRIDKEYAKKFLSLHAASSVYRHREIPHLKFNSNGISTDVAPTEAAWYYLLSDDSYSEVTVEKLPSYDSDIYVLSGEIFDFSFDVTPDWYGVKVYDGEVLLYDGVVGGFSDFSHNNESRLRAVISAEWYQDSTNLYHGTAEYDVLFDYDIKATYTMDKKEAFGGEALYINLMHVDNESLEITSTLPKAEALSSHSFSDGKLVIVPVPADTPAGEYKVTVKSDKTMLLIPFTVKDKNFDNVNISFVGSEDAESYNNAQSVFNSEISSAFDIVVNDANWINGLMTPVKKFVDGTEQYWISAPSFGVKQKVNGIAINERSKGIHYVKAVAAESLPLRAVANGTVAFSGTTTLYGNTVVLEHGLGFKTVYGHLDELNFAVGESVSMGDIIGIAKPSAYAVSSTEAFFGICIDGVFVNPYNYINEISSQDASEISEPVQFLTDIK